MQIKVLGCSGGIGGRARTTALLVDDDILIDAGTGVADLEQQALARIDHIFLTHSHVDHIASIPLMLDSVGPLRRRPLTLHGQADTLDILREHLFNWKIWPDFTRIPDETRPYLVMQNLRPGAPVDLGGRSFTAVPVEHTVPAVGYVVTGGRGSLAFSGDMAESEAFWEAVNACADLRYLLIETTFPDEQAELSRLSGHLCPSMLAAQLARLKARPEIYITHLMPGQETAIMKEIQGHLPGTPPRALGRGQVFRL